MKAARILIVEDESIVALALRVRLKRMGYEVCGMALSAEEAIERAARLRPDLVLMDIDLGRGPDGIQAAAVLQARFGVRVMYVTGQDDQETRQKAKGTEPLGYVIKPLTEEGLRQAIDGALQNLETHNRPLSNTGRHRRMSYEEYVKGELS